MNKKFMALTALLVAVVGTGFQVSGTYAKYTSKIDFTDSARVAKWGFGEDVKTVELFANSYTVKGGDYDGLVYAKNLSSDGKDIVAPGTTGSYEFEFDRFDTEVAYTIGFTLDKDNSKDIVLYYTKDENGKVTAVSKETEGALTYSPIKYRLSYANAIATEGNPITSFVALKADETTFKHAANTENDGWLTYDEFVKALEYIGGEKDHKIVYQPGEETPVVTGQPVANSNTVTFKIEWKWDATTGTDNDTLDTLLAQGMSDGTANKDVILQGVFNATQYTEATNVKAN